MGFVLPFFLISSGSEDLRVFAAIVSGVVGVNLAILGTRHRLPVSDVEKGLLFGVRWGHYLWLWLPWQYVIANAVWLVIPPFFSAGPTPAGWEIIAEIVLSLVVNFKMLIILLFLGYSAVEAFNCLRHDAPWTRGEAALRFIGWFLLAPIVLNMARVFGFL